MTMGFEVESSGDETRELKRQVTICARTKAMSFLKIAIAFLMKEKKKKNIDIGANIAANYRKLLEGV